MTAREIIQKKRDRVELTPAEIRWIVDGYTRSEIADYHISALLMAIFLNGMTPREVMALTLAMRDSGKVLDLGDLSGTKVDKHSTGGVGDKTSLLLAPIAAACGVIVPMITGRALGHTGGTLDKLESISGFNPRPSPDAIREQLRTTGAVIMGQTDDLAPADRKIYALRDVTGTVESIPLITASILSKKLAEGIDGLVMDVKTGSGAFMPTRRLSTELARSIATVCRGAKTRCVSLITDMDQPLGRAIGNALEVRECVEFLNGDCEERMEDLTLTLSAHMIRLGKASRNLEHARQLAYEAVSSGEAWRRFREIVRAQGGDLDVIDHPEKLPRADHVDPFVASKSGFLARADAKLLGVASNTLGAGRLRVDDKVDLAVGLQMRKRAGDRVKKGDVLCDVHWNDSSRLELALPLIRQAFEIRATRTRPRPLVHAVLEG